MSNEIKIEEPTLISFIDKVVELAKQGYTPSKTNQGSPQSWGLGLFTCGMVLEASQSPSETPKEDTGTSTQETDEKASEEVSEPSEVKSEEKPKTTQRRTRRKSTSTKK